MVNAIVYNVFIATHILRLDHRSYFRPDVLYARKSERVMVISVHGNVAIVEGIKGNRFPVDTDKLIVILKNERSDNQCQERLHQIL